jgi:hypothetical protein
MQQLLDDEPDQLSILPTFTTGPDGNCAFFLWGVWNGTTPNGEQMVHRALGGLEGMQMLQQGFTPYKASLDPGTIWPWGQRWAGDTQTISRVDESVAEMMAQAGRDMLGPNSTLFLHEFHGAPTRVPSEATAFRLRANHFVWMACGHWTDGDELAAYRQQAWVKQVSAAMRPRALSGGYVNFLHPDYTGRVRQFYGASAERLIRLKQQLDPHAMFVAASGRFS